MKGLPVHVEIGAGTMSVNVWVSSPTGDSSDSFIQVIPCLSYEQARQIGMEWAKAFGLPSDHIAGFCEEI